MASTTDLLDRIKKARQEILQVLPDIATRNTVVAKALIERAIREKGFGAMYSNNKLPTWFFDGKEKSNAGKSFIAAQKKKDATADEGEEVGMTWEDLRRAEGLQTDHVDLGFTNKMWAGMGPQQPFYNGKTIVVPLGGNTREVVDKMNWNRDRYGDYLGKMLGAKEIEILSGVALDEIGLILKNNGF